MQQCTTTKALSIFSFFLSLTHAFQRPVAARRVGPWFHKRWTVRSDLQPKEGDIAHWLLLVAPEFDHVCQRRNHQPIRRRGAGAVVVQGQSLRICIVVKLVGSVEFLLDAFDPPLACTVAAFAALVTSAAKREITVAGGSVDFKHPRIPMARTPRVHHQLGGILVRRMRQQMPRLKPGRFSVSKSTESEAMFSTVSGLIIRSRCRT